jgi:hypothetical protein
MRTFARQKLLAIGEMPAREVWESNWSMHEVETLDWMKRSRKKHA